MSVRGMILVISLFLNVFLAGWLGVLYYSEELLEYERELNRMEIEKNREANHE